MFVKAVQFSSGYSFCFFKKHGVQYTLHYFHSTLTMILSFWIETTFIIAVLKFLRYKERFSTCNLSERSNFLLVFFKDFIFLPNHQIRISLRPAVFLFLQVGFFLLEVTAKLAQCC